MPEGFMYILECSDGSYYTGSTVNLDVRVQQHQNGEGANHTKKHLPVKLVYFESFQRIDEAFYREKQVQGWSRKKKEALINSKPELLNELSQCKNESHFSMVASAPLSHREALCSMVASASLSHREAQSNSPRTLSGAEAEVEKSGTASQGSLSGAEAPVKPNKYLNPSCEI